MTIGFASGNFSNLPLDLVRRLSTDYIDFFKAEGLARAIEIHCPDEKTIDTLLKKNVDLSFFKFVSIHAPEMDCVKEAESEKILSKLRILKEKYGAKNIIFHPKETTNWNIFNRYFDLPISIENMDNFKKFGKTNKEISSVLKKYPFGLTLDLQHCFSNDSSMKIAMDFQNKFKDRIIEYHLSGLGKDVLHYPLFKTKQDIIINSLIYKKTPIIIESVFNCNKDHKKELEYILKNY